MLEPRRNCIYIRKPKRDLKETESPPGYKKIDKEIITRVNRIPGSGSSHKKNKSNLSRNIIHSKHTSKTSYNA